MKEIIVLRGLTGATLLGLFTVAGGVACSDPETGSTGTSSSSSSSSGESTSTSGSSSSSSGVGGQGGSTGQGGGGGSAACSLDNGLLGQWSGEDNANDTKGAANGVWTGAETYVAGKVGKAFVFDGASSVKAPFAHMGKSVTVDLWVKATDMSPATSESALSSADSAGETGSIQIDSDGGGMWRLFFSFPQVFGAIDNTQFQHLAFTCDGAKSRVFFNGKLADEMGVANSAVFKVLKLGVNRNDDHSLKAAIDEVHVWDRVLSDAEIAALHDNPKAKLCP